MALGNLKKLLKDIQSDDLEQMYMNVTRKACEWAVAGFIDEANLLLTALWKHGWEHTGHVWLPDEGFQVMWEVSGRAPNRIPFELKRIEDIEARLDYELFQFSGGRPADPYAESLSRLNGTRLYVKIKACIYRKEEPSAILAALDRALVSDETAANYLFEASTYGALIAAKENLIEQALHFVRLWGEGYLKYPHTYMLPYLMRNRATARILLTGALAPTFGLTGEKCGEELEQIAQYLDKRAEEGRTLVYGRLTWKELLKKISIKTIAKNQKEFSEQVIKSNWLGKAPASLQAIQETEIRLSVQFPEDYKTFLLTSNGFDCLPYSIDVQLLPIEQVEYFRIVDSETVSIWTETNRDADDLCKNLTSAILIGNANTNEQQLLLIPLENQKWECWFFAYWVPGEIKYPSFRFYMEELLQRLEE